MLMLGTRRGHVCVFADKHSPEATDLSEMAEHLAPGDIL